MQDRSEIDGFGYYYELCHYHTVRTYGSIGDDCNYGDGIVWYSA